MINFNFQLCACCISLSLLFIIILLLTIFPSLEIYFAFTYNNIPCDNNLDISIENWLLINSISTFICMFFIGLLLYLNFHKNFFYYKLKTFLIFFLILKFVWIMVGMIIFYTFCYDLEPKFLNIFINFNFILTTLFVFISLFMIIYKNNHNKENPMLILPN